MPFTKITESDMQGKGVQGQPDVPGLSAAEMQRKVEEIVRDVTNVAFNRLIDELFADTAAGNIGATLDGMSSGSTLQAVLNELNKRQNTHAQKTNNPHSVTAAQVGAYTKQETDEAIDKKVEAIGAADMSKSEFAQPGEYGVVKEAKNAQKLDGKPPEYYMPVGTVLPFSGTSLPDGWLWCGGNAISRTQYSALFAVIGTTYGNGDGNSTFNIPDLRGRVVAMRGDSQSVGDKEGERTHKLTLNELASHNSETGSFNGVVLGDGRGSGTTSVVEFGNTSYKQGNAMVTQKVGGDQPHNNMQPTIYMNYIIKY